MKRFFSEAVSWLSCGLNVLTGGEREITFSAESWRLYQYGETRADRTRGERRVRWVDALNRLVTGEQDHCRAAWDAHCARWLDYLGQATRPD